MSLTIWEIQKELGLKQTGDNSYKGVICTGAFRGLHDYGAGLLVMQIGNTQPVLTLHTVDDGSWSAFGETDIHALAKDIQDSFSLVLPSEEEFNMFLRKHGLFGTCTG